MIQPVNNHLLIEPLKHETFMASDKDIYEEIGVVIGFPQESNFPIKNGDKVFFDSWLAAKYREGDKTYWLVNWNDVRAIDEDKISK